MGRIRGPYNADFPVGSAVRIAGQEVLKGFQRPQWVYHHPLDAAQLEQAGRVTKVLEVGYYHGGDEMYELEGIPGLWHEACLEVVS